MIGAALRGLTFPFSAFIFVSAAAGQIGADVKPLPRPLDIRHILSWMAADTETVIVARDFTLPDLADKARVYTQELAFAALPTSTWGINAPLTNHFKNQKVLVAVEGSRKFRSPKSLGLMPFEGCTVLLFADRQDDRPAQYFKAASGAALREEEIEGHRVLLFQGRSEADMWTTFVAFTRPDMLLVATNIDYLREVLSRIGGKAGPRALPETLPEWSYVDVGARFWGLRHFDRSRGDHDPSSPFWDPRKFVKSPWSDKQAIGLTFSYDPATGKRPTITYLSGNPNAGKETLSLRHEGSKFDVSVRELDARAISASYSLEHPESIIFTFYLGALLGHVINL
jgi:hypothetical protein